MKLKERKKILLSLSIATFSLAVLAWPHTTKALFGESIAGTIGHSILWVITLIIDLIGGFVITIAASLLNYVWRFQSFIKVPAVQIGWTMSRDLANMGFILIMLTMAFGTILRIDTYGWKKLLPKLIFVALLINFSLIIGGIFIDIGNSLGLFFVSGGDQEAGTPQVGDFIMTAMASGKWAQLRNEISIAGDAVSTLVMGSIVQLIFYMIMAFLLLALGFIMIFRMINLWILLMLAPLAWISYALPKGSNYWGQWWNKFLSWAFFPAIMGFFIFLGLLVGASFQGGSFTGPTDVGGWGWLFPESLFASVMQFIAVVAILFMGLIKAQSLSGAGSKLMMNGVGKMQNWTAGKIKGVAKSPLKVPGLGVRAVDKATGGEATRKLMQGREWLEKQPLIGKAVGGPGAAYQRQQKLLSEEKGKLSKLRPQDLEVIIKQIATTPQGLARRAAALSTLAEKGQLKDQHKAYLQDYVNSGGNMKEVLDHRADWAYDGDVQKVLARAPSPLQDQWKDISSETNDTERLRKVDELIATKLLGKVEDFAKIQKEAITQGMNPFADRLKGVLSEQFKDGGKLYTSHLNAMAGKNEESYHQMIQYLTSPRQIIDTQTQQTVTRAPIDDPNMKPQVRQNITAGPAAATLGTAPPPTPQPPAPAGGAATP